MLLEASVLVPCVTHCAEWTRADASPGTPTTLQVALQTFQWVLSVGTLRAAAGCTGKSTILLDSHACLAQV